MKLGTHLCQYMVTCMHASFVTLTYLSWSTDFEKNGGLPYVNHKHIGLFLTICKG